MGAPERKIICIFLLGAWTLVAGLEKSATIKMGGAFATCSLFDLGKTRDICCGQV